MTLPSSCLPVHVTNFLQYLFRGLVKFWWYIICSVYNCLGYVLILQVSEFPGQKMFHDGGSKVPTRAAI